MIGQYEFGGTILAVAESMQRVAFFGDRKGAYVSIGLLSAEKRGACTLLSLGNLKQERQISRGHGKKPSNEKQYLRAP